MQHGDGDQREEVAEAGHHPGREQLVERLDVGRDARDAADRPGLRSKNAIGKPLQVREQLESGDPA